MMEKIMNALEKLCTPRPLEQKPPVVLAKLSSAKKFTLTLAVVMAYILFLMFTLLVFLSPLLIQSEDKTMLGLGVLAYNIVSVFMMCHQLPMRSLFISGIQQAVCARDMGIYLGVAVAGIIFLKKTPDYMKTKKFFLLTVIPIALDGITQTILNLRESNNLLRIATGLIFGFGLTLFILTRIKSLNTNEFKETLRDIKFIILTALSTLIALSLLSTTASLLGSEYVSKSEAIQLANATANAEAYYIPPRTPLTYYFYPHKQNYNDYILSDLEKMDWVESQINMLLFNDTVLFNDTEMPDFFKMDAFPLKHYYGMWTVVQTAENQSTRENPVYTNKKGSYAYIDAITKEVFERQEH